jgi:CRP-like cAMP-binding protein
MNKPLSLKEISLFSQLSERSQAELAGFLQSRQLAAGEVIFNQGEPGDELIIVQEGEIAIYVPVEGLEGGGQPIRIFQAGELLGEMALIDRRPRSLSARAEQPSSILVLRGDDFRRLLDQNPDMSHSIMAGLSERIRYTTDFLSEVRTWVQRIAEGNYQAGVNLNVRSYKDPSLEALAAEFARMATVVQQREETLRQEVIQLRIEIDQTKRKQEAERIMGSDYYKSLKQKAENLRKRDV